MYSTRNIGFCPYGVPGDRLWVRETWGLHPDVDEQLKEDHCAPASIDLDDAQHVGYRADQSGAWAVKKWRPSIFMPRWASRITLEVVNVRVERVQEITDTGGMREGWKCDPNNLDYLPRQWFRDLWDSINANRGYSWESNPWVWVIEFRRVK